jgi:hypothetical protein
MDQQTTAVDLFLEAVRTATIDDCDAWARDATLDATVPNWRFHERGAEAIRETYRGWFADPGRFDELQRYPVPGGEIVRYLLAWAEDGVPHTAHHLHVLTVVDDRIAADVVVCGGRWPAALMAEMEAADVG